MKEERLNPIEYIGKGNHIRVTKRKSCSYHLHSHNYFEIEVVIDGRGTHYLNGVPYPITPRSLFLMTPSDFHSLDITEIGDVVNIAFDETLIPQDILVPLLAGGISLTADEELFGKIMSVCELMNAEQSNGEAIGYLLPYFLSLIVKPIGTVPQTDAISRAVAYLDLHFKESPSLNETARVVSLSPSYFGELFKRTLGMTYLDYLTERKLRSAKILLRGGMSVSEAAFSSGFGSLSGFLYAFRKKYGISPSDYKSKHK